MDNFISPFVMIIRPPKKFEKGYCGEYLATPCIRMKTSQKLLDALVLTCLNWMPRVPGFEVMEGSSHWLEAAIAGDIPNAYARLHVSVQAPAIWLLHWRPWSLNKRVVFPVVLCVTTAV